MAAPRVESHKGTGVRTVHRVACKAAARRCECPKDWWLTKVGDRRDRSARFYGTLTEAIREKARQEDEAESERRRLEATGLSASPTLHEWTVAIMREKSEGVEVTTLSNYDFAYRTRLYPYLGGHTLHAITPVVVADWMTTRIAEEGNRHCVLEAYKLLRHLLNLAADRRVIDFNPVRSVNYPLKQMTKGKRSRERSITFEQYQTLLAVCTHPGHRVLLRLAVEAGLRSGELAGVRFRDVEAGEPPCIRVERNVKDDRINKRKVVGVPKSCKPRAVAITRDLLGELERYRQWLEVTHGVTGVSYMFPGKDGRTGTLSYDTPQNRYAARDAVRRLCKRAGLVDEYGNPLTTPHGLRATGATIASHNGVNPVVIQHQLGHVDLRTTQESYLDAPPPALLADYARVFE